MISLEAFPVITSFKAPRISNKHVCYLPYSRVEREKDGSQKVSSKIHSTFSLSGKDHDDIVSQFVFGSANTNMVDKTQWLCSAVERNVWFGVPVDQEPSIDQIFDVITNAVVGQKYQTAIIPYFPCILESPFITSYCERLEALSNIIPVELMMQSKRHLRSDQKNMDHLAEAEWSVPCQLNKAIEWQSNELRDLALNYVENKDPHTDQPDLAIPDNSLTLVDLVPLHAYNVDWNTRLANDIYSVVIQPTGFDFYLTHTTRKKPFVSTACFLHVHPNLASNPTLRDSSPLLPMSLLMDDEDKQSNAMTMCCNIVEEEIMLSSSNLLGYVQSNSDKQVSLTTMKAIERNLRSAYSLSAIVLPTLTITPSYKFRNSSSLHHIRKIRRSVRELLQSHSHSRYFSTIPLSIVAEGKGKTSTCPLSYTSLVSSFPLQHSMNMPLPSRGGWSINDSSSKEHYHLFFADYHHNNKERANDINTSLSTPNMISYVDRILSFTHMSSLLYDQALGYFTSLDSSKQRSPLVIVDLIADEDEDTKGRGEKVGDDNTVSNDGPLAAMSSPPTATQATSRVSSEGEHEGKDKAVPVPFSNKSPSPLDNDTIFNARANNIEQDNAKREDIRHALNDLQALNFDQIVNSYLTTSSQPPIANLYPQQPTEQSQVALDKTRENRHVVSPTRKTRQSLSLCAGYSILLAEELLEVMPALYSTLSEKFGIHCLDVPLQYADILVNASVAVLIFDPYSLDNPQAYEMRLLQLTHLALKCSNVYVLLASSEEGLSESKYLEVCRSVLRFPISVIIRACGYEIESLSSSIAHIVQHSMQSSLKCANWTRDRLYKTPFLDRLREGKVEACMVLQYFPSVNFYLASELMAFCSVQDLCSMKETSVLRDYLAKYNANYEELVVYVEQLIHLLHVHIGLVMLS